MNPAELYLSLYQCRHKIKIFLCFMEEEAREGKVPQACTNHTGARRQEALQSLLPPQETLLRFEDLLSAGQLQQIWELAMAD